MYRSIVAGTDGSATALEAVRHAGALAAACDARLTVVSAYRPMTAAAVLAMSSAVGAVALDTTQLAEEQRQDAVEILEHAVMSLGVFGVQTSTRAEAGDAAEVLLAVAADEQADLLVVGNRGMSGARRFLLGSVPNRVAHHADCSVLVVHTC
ncbi:MAG: universal stress protein [Actinobacteria bacterium]|nr:universal stress protein [Actinomycetota bacterium]MCA1721659.1 universal stress protein [Actinomycetota bacterium]